MPRHYIQHVVNAGIGPDGHQRCRRCKEPLPFVGNPGGPPNGYEEGRVLVVQDDAGVVMMLGHQALERDPDYGGNPECITAQGEVAEIA